MPRRTFDKKTATTFSLVYRSQNDALIHDENAPSMVFTEKQTPYRPQLDDDSNLSSSASVVSGSSRSSRVRPRGDLDAEFGATITNPNEGEAAQHGVFYDDTKYDYMKHMRDLGTGSGPTMWVDGSAPLPKKKGKMRLEDALRAMDFGDAGDAQSVGGSSMASSARSLLPEEVLPSEFVQKRTYQDQQDVPDAIAGFQPDMDPRLREVLEALEDEEYVDEDEDIFGQLTGDGAEVDREEWERLGEQQAFDEGEAELDEGWESDDTIRARSPSRASKLTPFAVPETEDAKPPEDPHAAPAADPTGGAWQEVYAQLKADTKAETKAAKAAPSALDASILSSLASGRRKKRKGAKTSTTNYSMTSSALLRTEQQTLLDSRLDAILEKEDSLYDEDDEMNDDGSMVSGMTGLSKASRASRYSNISGLSGVSGMSGMSSYSRASDAEAPMLERADFDGIMDDFLGKYNKAGKAGLRVRRGKPMTGMEQLDEVRAGLGPARLKKSVARTT